MVIVKHLVTDRIVIQGVDSKVASRRIFMLLTKYIVAQYAAMFVNVSIFGLQSAKRGHLNGVWAKHDMDQSKSSANNSGAPKTSLNLFGLRIRGDIKILGPYAQH